MKSIYNFKSRTEIYKMFVKFSTYLSVTELLLLLTLLTSNHADVEAKGPSTTPQPLASLDKMLSQVNGVKVDAIMDPKVTSNVTNLLNEMAMNMRKVLFENRRISSQVQDVLHRVQNATGVNATTAINNMQQPLANASNLTNMNNLNNVLSRFQVA